jgi:hypothetical protein
LTDVCQWRTIKAGLITVWKIIETTIFTRQIQDLTQATKNTGNTSWLFYPSQIWVRGHTRQRRVAKSSVGRGRDTDKRGGVQVIYYWVKIQERILMLLIYAKAEQDDLTPDQLKVLRRIIEEEYP